MTESDEPQMELTQQELALAEADYDTDPEEIESSAEPTDDAETEVAELDDSVTDEVSEGADSEVALEDEAEELAEEEPAETEEEVSVFSDADYELGQSYGLSKEEVEKLGSRDTLENFGRIYDEKMLANKEAASEQTEKASASKEAESENDEVQFDISKVDLSEYDKTTQEVFKVIDKLQSEVGSLRARNVQLETEHENSSIEQFGRTLDEMDGEFYGEQYGSGSKAKGIKKDHMDRRIQLAEAVDTLTAGYVSTGKPVPPLDVLVKNAHQITFRERANEVQKTNSAKRLKKQAARKRGAGSRTTSRQVSQEPMDDEEREIARIMELTEKPYRQMLDSNGG